ncbi:hypothetical protein APA_430 [Pseudanabaena sp. lw0831]|nr:hypothetical protein APA_430 [Pseudanabaena sp. lw0831]
MGNNCPNDAETVKIWETTKNRLSGSAKWDFLHNQEWLYMAKSAT